jgi:hypothetical protein
MQLHQLILHTSKMTRTITHLKDRLRFLLLKARFANELYHLICALGFPERALGTFVRSAKTSSAFKTLTFRTQRAASPQGRGRFPTTLQEIKVKSKGATQPVVAFIPNTDPLAIARPYLPEEDKTIGFA